MTYQKTRGGIRSQRRRTDWTLGPITQPTAITATGVLLGASFVVGVSGAGETLVRTRGDGLAYLTAATNPNDGFIGAFGIGYATTAAMTAGIASLPTPITEEDADSWVFHQYIHCLSPHTIDGTASTDTPLVPTAFRFSIDSKAMRKVTDDDVGFYMAWEFTEVGTAVLQVQARVRMLTKLS